VLALLAGWLVHAIDGRRRLALRLATAGLACWLLVLGAPAYARRTYTVNNVVMRELEWELEQVSARRGPLLMITSKATLPYLLHRVSAVNVSFARARGPEIAWHLRRGTFREVLVAQVLRPTSAEGNAVVDPEDALPDHFRLTPIARKRFGGRWVELSRVAVVDPEPPPPAPPTGC